MMIELTQRHFGVHNLVADAEIPGAFSDYATVVPAPANAAWSNDWVVDEDKLIAALPDGFLPSEPGRVLLGVSEEDGGTAVGKCARFRSWAKYFDAHMLWLLRDACDE